MARDMVEVEVFREATENPPVDLAKIDTLHELLALAIGDFEQVLADDRYSIDMSVWHVPDEGLCHVCLAGSMIASRLSAEPDDTWLPECFPKPIAWRLATLNQLRVGATAEATAALKEAGVTISPDRYFTAHSLELNKWRDRIPYEFAWAKGAVAGRFLLAHLRELHADLQEAGL